MRHKREQPATGGIVGAIPTGPICCPIPETPSEIAAASVEPFPFPLPAILNEFQYDAPPPLTKPHYDDKNVQDTQARMARVLGTFYEKNPEYKQPKTIADYREPFYSGYLGNFYTADEPEGSDATKIPNVRKQRPAIPDESPEPESSSESLSEDESETSTVPDGRSAHASLDSNAVITSTALYIPDSETGDDSPAPVNSPKYKGLRKRKAPGSSSEIPVSVIENETLSSRRPVRQSTLNHGSATRMRTRGSMMASSSHIETDTPDYSSSSESDDEYPAKNTRKNKGKGRAKSDDDEYQFSDVPSGSQSRGKGRPKSDDEYQFSEVPRGRQPNGKKRIRSVDYDDDEYQFSGVLRGLQSKAKVPRRSRGEMNRKFFCFHPHCNKGYETLPHLNNHLRIKRHGKHLRRQQYDDIVAAKEAEDEDADDEDQFMEFETGEGSEQLREHGDGDADERGERQAVNAHFYGRQLSGYQPVQEEDNDGKGDEQGDEEEDDDALIEAHNQSRFFNPFQRHREGEGGEEEAEARNAAAIEAIIQSRLSNTFQSDHEDDDETILAEDEERYDGEAALLDAPIQPRSFMYQGQNYHGQYLQDEYYYGQYPQHQYPQHQYPQHQYLQHQYHEEHEIDENPRGAHASMEVADSEEEAERYGEVEDDIVMGIERTGAEVEEYGVGQDLIQGDGSDFSPLV